MNLKLRSFLLLGAVALLTGACVSSYKIVDSQYANYSIDAKTDSLVDQTYNDLLKPYSDKLQDDLSEVVALADTSLVAYRPESPLSNFISDLLLKHGRNWAKNNHADVDLSFSLANSGGLRTSLPAGEIKVRNIFELLPFENELVLLKLTGGQVEVLANHIASRDGEGVAGIRFGIKDGKAVDIEIGGKPLNKQAEYWMITNDYIANGGDGMKILREASSRVETGEKIRDMVISELRMMTQNSQHITAKTDGRIYHVE